MKSGKGSLFILTFFLLINRIKFGGQHNAYNKVEHINTVNFIRRFQETDDNEKLEILLRKLKTFHISISKIALKNHELFNLYYFSKVSSTHSLN